MNQVVERAIRSATGAPSITLPSSFKLDPSIPTTNNFDAGTIEGLAGSLQYRQAQSKARLDSDSIGSKEILDEIKDLQSELAKFLPDAAEFARIKYPRALHFVCSEYLIKLDKLHSSTEQSDSQARVALLWLQVGEMVDLVVPVGKGSRTEARINKLPDLVPHGEGRDAFAAEIVIALNRMIKANIK